MRTFLFACRMEKWKQIANEFSLNLGDGSIGEK